MSVLDLLKTAPPKDVTRLLLLRHGEADAAPGTIVGTADLALSARGREQMERAKRLLTGVGLQAVYTSNLRRALESCKILLEGRTSCLPNEQKELQEQHFGSWQGHTLETLKKNEPQAAFFTDPVDGRPPGGETFSEVRKRVISWWRQTSVKYKNGHVLIVTSVAPLRAFLCEALDLSSARAQRLMPGAGTLTIIDVGPSIWVAHAMGA